MVIVTPQPIIDQLYQATAKVVRDEVFQKDLDKLGTEAVADSNPRVAAQLIKDEMVKWASIVKATGTKAQ